MNANWMQDDELSNISKEKLEIYAYATTKNATL